MATIKSNPRARRRQSVSDDDFSVQDGKSNQPPLVTSFNFEIGNETREYFKELLNTLTSKKEPKQKSRQKTLRDRVIQVLKQTEIETDRLTIEQTILLPKMDEPSDVFGQE
jgi:hypothetical protein